MRKYLAILKYSLKTQFTFLANYLFSLFSFTVHVFVFNELWDYILGDKTAMGYTKSELIWYIIIAECITYSNFKCFKKIGDMVKQGDIANMLLKPIDIVNYLFMENTAVVIKAFINIIWAIVLGLVLAGPITVTVGSCVMALIAIVVAIIIGTLFQIFLGILAFFTEENQSYNLVLQKISFFVLFTPLEFYPQIVQKLLFFLPSTLYIYAPAKIFTKFQFSESFALLVFEILSGFVLYALIRFMYKKGVEKINVNGG